MLAFGLDEPALVAAGALEKFKRIVEVGHARDRVTLRAEIKSRMLKTRKNAGSVNAMQLCARNKLGWDRQAFGQAEEPDLSTARERLRQTLLKLATQRSQIEGQTVTPCDLLYREAHGVWPWEGAEGGQPEESASAMP